ncbi:stage V sporulation protein T [Oscillospiraceae bacterium NTUH-002-81]|jgi:stage V sporulation protein T|nr:stage V sporulation protein T [Oscillospiraceae bacterium NTUH-002-81]
MKATGIVRRIDDLGRVVIPKEIRRTLRIREGTPLEIFTDREGEIILKKYSPIGELGAFAGQYAESLAQTTGLTVCVCDRDQVIAVSGGSRKELLGKNISRQLETVIEDRENILVDNKEYKYIQITDNDREDFTGEAVSPILCEGDAIGAVVILSREPKQLLGETEQKLAISAAGFLGKQMEQ